MYVCLIQPRSSRSSRSLPGQIDSYQIIPRSFICISRYLPQVSCVAQVKKYRHHQDQGGSRSLLGINIGRILPPASIVLTCWAGPLSRVASPSSTGNYKLAPDCFPAVPDTTRAARSVAPVDIINQLDPRTSANRIIPSASCVVLCSSLPSLPPAPVHDPDSQLQLLHQFPVRDS